jgi:hypothetical protein
LEPGVSELATGRVRPIGGPGPNAIGTAEFVVQQSDCASDLKVNNAPDENFPAVFATTRMIAQDPAGEIGRGTHKRAIISRERLVSGAAKRA